MSCSSGRVGVGYEGDTCNFTCNTGYELTGSDTRTCQSDGSWVSGDDVHDGSWNGDEDVCRIGKLCISHYTVSAYIHYMFITFSY